ASQFGMYVRIPTNKKVNRPLLIGQNGDGSPAVLGTTCHRILGKRWHNFCRSSSEQTNASSKLGINRASNAHQFTASSQATADNLLPIRVRNDVADLNSTCDW